MEFQKDLHGSRRAGVEPLGPGVLLELRHRAGRGARVVHPAKKRSESQEVACVVNLRLKTALIGLQYHLCPMRLLLQQNQARMGIRSLVRKKVKQNLVESPLRASKPETLGRL